MADKIYGWARLGWGLAHVVMVSTQEATGSMHETTISADTSANIELQKACQVVPNKRYSASRQRYSEPIDGEFGDDIIVFLHFPFTSSSHRSQPTTNIVMLPRDPASIFSLRSCPCARYGDITEKERA